MQTLIRKEMREIARPFLVLFVLLCALWFAVAKFEDVLLRPLQEPVLSVIAVCAFWGAALGFGQFSSERWRGTNAFLVHRGTGRWGAFAAKAVVGSLSTWCLAAVPPLLFALWYWLATPYGPVVQGARVGELLVIALFAFPCYGAGVVAAALRRARGWSWLVALLGTCGAVIVALWASMMLANRGLGWFGAILGVALVAAGLLALAWHLLRLEDDREFALPPRHSAALALATLVLVVAPLLIGAMVLRVFLAEGLGWTPLIVQSRSTQEIFVLAPDPGDGWRRLDGKGVVGGVEYLRSWHPWGSSGDVRTIYNPAYGPVTTEPKPWPAPTDGVEGSFVARMWVTLGVSETLPDGWRTDSVLDLQDGLVRSFVLPPARDVSRASSFVQRPGAGVAQEFALTKTGGARFSPATVALGSGGKSTALCDASDGSLWLFVQGPGEPRLERLELPDGDRFARLEYLYQPEAAEIGWYAVDWSIGPLVVGERGRYVWQALAQPAGLVAYDAWQTPPRGSAVAGVTGPTPTLKPIPASEVPVRLVARLDTLDSDPLHPSFAVRSAHGDELLCTLSVEPQTQRAVWAERLLLALAFVQPPWATAASFVGPVPTAYPGRANAATSDLFAGGRRAGLAAACVGLALALAAWIVLRGSGSRGPRWTWAVLVALFGLPVFAMYLLCEPRRSRRQITRSTVRELAAASTPLIQSA